MIQNIIKHYDKLLSDGNDPFHDPAELKEYMDKWDGPEFIKAMNLDCQKSVLEIGCGTGRIAAKIIPACKAYYGVDISQETINRARTNLNATEGVKLICGDFMALPFACRFDVVCSTLTFMHFHEKEKCIKKVYYILTPGGRFVLSVDKNKNEYIDYPGSRLRVYPDDPVKTEEYILTAGFTLIDIIETELAYIFVCQKP